MVPSIRCLFSVAVLATAAALPAQDAPQPDKLVLKSGTVLVGTIKTITAAEVEIDIVEQGGIKIAWADIEAINTGKPLLLGTQDNARFDGVVKGRAGDQLEVIVDGTLRQVPIAQFEHVVGGREGVEWKGLITLGLAAATGNTTRRTANANLDVQRRTEDDRWQLKVRWNQESNKDPVTLGWSRTDQYIGGVLYAFGRAAAERDHNAQLDLRVTIDAGLGYQLVDTGDVAYSIQAGVGYISNEYFNPADDEDSAIGTLSHKFNWKIVADLEFLHSASVIQSLEDKDDVLVKADTRLRWTMITDMFAELQWLFDYDNTPATGAERIDNRYFLSLGWSF
jgi:putative salt-induced outer membrane protein YdiY